MHRSLLLLPALLLVSCAMQPPTGDLNGGSHSTPASEVPAEEDGTVYNPQLPAGTFTEAQTGSAHGSMYMRGYSEIVPVIDPFCEENCQTYDYVYFRIQETGNAAFVNFLSEHQDNQYVGPARVGLGCVASGIISYSNHSDLHGLKEFALSAQLSQSILGATPEQPITLMLNKEQLSGGMGAPACYAHFTTVEEVASPAADVGSDASPSVANAPADAGGECMIAGCSNELCVESSQSDVATTCEWKPEYACFQGATCERQVTGKCDWTQTPEVEACLVAAMQETPSATEGQ